MVDDTTRDGATLDPPRLFRRRTERHGGEAANSLAALDDLTGLRNQRALWRELTRRVALCSQRTPLSVVLVDFDAFGELNEVHGHSVADQVLRRAASVMRDAGVSPRLAFRYSGEEFVVLAAGGAPDGRAIAEQVRAQIERQNGRLPSTTVSCGVAVLETPVEPWVAMDRADAALHEAKRAGGNRVEVAGDTPATADAYLLEALERETPRRAALALAVASATARTVETVEDPEDVLALCEAVGRRIGLGPAELNRLLAGAQLHDVGKVAVPPELFNKAGPLTDDERAIIEEHTVVGEGILRSVPEMDVVATIVRHSQEHWDGSGQPDGLAGEEIPLASRIIFCASAFRSMRMDRPYRPSRPAEEAIAELRKCAGTQFDPTVVTALVEVAEGVRRADADPRVVTALPRSRRLSALLLALTLSTGTAFAAIPEVRDLIRSIFGLDDGPSDVYAPGVDGRGFSLGPIGDALSLRPVEVGGPAGAGDGAARASEVVPLAVAVRRARGGDPDAPPPQPRTVFGEDDDAARPVDRGRRTSRVPARPAPGTSRRREIPVPDPLRVATPGQAPTRTPARALTLDLVPARVLTLDLVPTLVLTLDLVPARVLTLDLVPTLGPTPAPALDPDLVPTPILTPGRGPGPTRRAGSNRPHDGPKSPLAATTRPRNPAPPASRPARAGPTRPATPGVRPVPAPTRIRPTAAGETAHVVGCSN